MKIAYISPGSGDSFYCENCIRDRALVKAMARQGHQVSLIPLYLPVLLRGDELGVPIPVFYGAINIYLNQFYPAFRKAPRWIKKILDSQFFLKIAAGFAGSTNAAGLNKLTISMLEGDRGNQAEDLDVLIRWMKEHEKPDVVHLATALLSGTAKRIKEELNVPVVCSLEDEDVWIDEMGDPFAERAWNIIDINGRYIDLFLPVSHYYKDYMSLKLPGSANKMEVVYNGVDASLYEAAPHPVNPPVIGFMSRMCAVNGLDVLVDAYIRLRKRSSMAKVELHLAGGLTRDDKSFFHSQMKKLKDAGVFKEVVVYHSFDVTERSRFLKSLSVLSVPVPRGNAFGLFLLEAFASGVPVLQPNKGAFGELIDLTGGGVTYSSGKLEEALFELLSSPEKMSSLGASGRKAATGCLGIESSVENTLSVYRNLLNRQEKKSNASKI